MNAPFIKLAPHTTSKALDFFRFTTAVSGGWDWTRGGAAAIILSKYMI